MLNDRLGNSDPFIDSYVALDQNTSNSLEVHLKLYQCNLRHRLRIIT